MLGSELRAFKYQETYITTFEDPIHDTDLIKTVWDSEDKDANLFPDPLSLPLRRDTIQYSQPINKPDGYAIRCSHTNFEWYPYLPAIVNFQYILFRGMSTDPEIIYTGSGYKLEDDDIYQRRNVEYVLCTAIATIQSGCITPLSHRSPLPPSEYGYTLSHRQEKFAGKSAMKSLNTFQRLLGYCSYLIASRTYRTVEMDHQDPPLESVFYPNPGPVIHPKGKAPTHTDYLAYRLDVAHFFKLYPHAHVAALCAGGILWRIAVDVLPIPAEHDLTPSFHPSACKVRTIGGQQYWTPVLCRMDEEMIVGVYKWPDHHGQLPQHNSWWPKPGVWSGSGLEFSSWAPLAEDWYQNRKDVLSGPTGSGVQAKKWRGDVKFERTLPPL